MPDIELPTGVTLRDWDDSPSLRTQIEEGAKTEMARAFPISHQGLRLELDGLDYADPPTYDHSRQREAILKDEYLHRRLRGKLRLVDEATGDILDEETRTLARVPWLTDRGTFIHGGNEYTVAHQSRLLPGPYTRVKANDELEAWFNVRRGTGSAMRIRFDPASAQYRLDVAGSSLKLYPILHALGVSDEELEEAWGADILQENKTYETRPIDTLYSKIVRNADPEASMPDKIAAIRERLDSMKLHRRVTARNQPELLEYYERQRQSD